MRVMHVTWGAFRRTAFGAVTVLVALFVTFSVTAGTGAAQTAAPIEPGVGNAIATTAVVGPSFANLSLAFAFGRSIAAHQNSVAQASSQAIDLGQIGATLAGEGCDGGDPTLTEDQQPHAARVDSRDAVTSKDEEETFLGGLPMHKHAEANPTPFAKAVTTIAPFGVAGVLEIGGGVATSTSGLVNGVREAKATTDISAIKLVGGLGLIELSGLHWEAVWTSTKPDGSGFFTIGSAKIAGTPLPTNDPKAVLDAVNTALTPAGIKLTPPAAHQDGGVLFVDPLGIAVVPSATRDAVAAVVLQNVQDLRRQVTDALIAQDCGNDTYITIADLVVGSVTGAGMFRADLGGVQASSGKSLESGFTFGAPQFITTGGIEPSLDAAIDTFVPEIGPVLTAPVTPARTSPRIARPVATTKPDGTRGGVMAVVGLLGLALLGLLAEGDRRKMRKAQREIPVT